MSSEKLSQDLLALLTPLEKEIFTPMATLTFRFSGQNGKAGALLHTAAEMYFKSVGQDGPTSLLGYLNLDGKKSAFIKQPKDLSKKAGLDFLFSSLKKFKGSFSADFANEARQQRPKLLLILKDGAGKDSRLAERAAGWLSFDPGFGPPQGTINLAFPLSELEDESKRKQWINLGDALFKSLSATSGWMTPALWSFPRTWIISSSHEITTTSALTLFGKFPQIDLPILYSGNDRIIAQDFKPHPYAGVLAPYWITWLDAELAKQVKKFPGTTSAVGNGSRFMIEETPPLEMNEDRYQTYKKAWAAYEPLHIKSSTPHSFFERYNANKLAAVSDTLNSLAAERNNRVREISKLNDTLYQAANSENPADAENAIALLDKNQSILPAAKALGYRYGLLYTLVVNNKFDKAKAKSLLSEAKTLAEGLDLWRAAKLATAVQDNSAALDLLAKAVKATHVGQEITRMKQDPAFKPLRKDPKFEKIFKKIY